jgi:hypothetical protein
MSDDAKVVRLDRAPRSREGYIDPATSFADELVHPEPTTPFQDGVPIARKPRSARDVNPRLAAPLVQTTFNVPAGCIGDYRWRSRVTKTWERWSSRAGPCTIRQPLTCDLGEFRTRPVGVDFEAPPPVQVLHANVSHET